MPKDENLAIVGDLIDQIGRVSRPIEIVVYLQPEELAWLMLIAKKTRVQTSEVIEKLVREKAFGRG